MRAEGREVLLQGYDCNRGMEGVTCKNERGRDETKRDKAREEGGKGRWQEA